MDIKATLEERVSKSGKPYKCIVIKIADGVEKVVFLTQAELALINLQFS